MFCGRACQPLCCAHLDNSRTHQGTACCLGWPQSRPAATASAGGAALPCGPGQAVTTGAGRARQPAGSALQVHKMTSQSAKAAAPAEGRHSRNTQIRPTCVGVCQSQLSKPAEQPQVHAAPVLCGPVDAVLLHASHDSGTGQHSPCPGLLSPRLLGHRRPG